MGVSHVTSHETANLTASQMGTVVLRPASVAIIPMATARSPRATTVALMGLVRLPLSVAKTTCVSASRLVVSAVPAVHTVMRGKCAAATVAQKRAIYAALMGRRAVRGTYASRMRSTAGTNAARIPLARHM